MGKRTTAKAHYGAVPADFPKCAPLSLWPYESHACQVSLYQGKYYPAGGSPPEIWQSWLICQELVEHFEAVCVEEKTMRSPLLPEAEIIEFHYQMTLAAGWGTNAEIAWIFRTVAKQLGWPVPLSAEKTMLG